VQTNIFQNKHLKETLSLAWPLILTQVGHIITDMVDTIFLGQIGVAEQAAGIFANNVYFLILVFGIGLSFASTPLVTKAHEENNPHTKASLFKNSLYLNGITALILFFIMYFLTPFLHYLKQPAEVLDLALPFYKVIAFSMVPLSVFFTCKQYCEGISNTKAALWVSIAGNLLNIFLNYTLIHGYFGLPQMGYLGVAWGTFYSRCFMGFAFLFLMYKTRVLNEVFVLYKQVKINTAHLKDLAKIGFNTGLQFTFEVAAFVIAGFMAGTFGKEQIDAHGIALHIAAFTYMFGSGISSAATIRVSIYRAQNNWQEVKNAGMKAIQIVILFMLSAAVVFLLLRNYLPLIFSSEHEVIALSAKLLIIAAFFQIFDGLQVTAIGILRGLEDVKYATYTTLIGYWFISLSACYLLAFSLELEVIGIWVGLLAGLIFVSVTLFLRFRSLYKKMLKQQVAIPVSGST